MFRVGAFVLLAPQFALRLVYGAAWASEYVGEMIAQTLLEAEPSSF
jgi:hypothetical protein